MSEIRSITSQLPRPDESPRWFAFRTMYKREKMVDKRLSAQDVECYVPLITEVRHYKSKRKVLRTPLLSSYVFVRLSAKQYPTVLTDPDVFEIVRFQGEVGRVTEDEIDFLRKILHDGEEDYDPRVREGLGAGTPVVITGGALAGTKGKILSQRGKHNFAVELHTLGVTLEINVDAHFLARQSQLDRTAAGIE